MALTREQVEDTALGILTRFGLADLSMRRLARELDVQVGALYWHVKNKQELLVGVAARLLRGLDAGDASVPDGTPVAGAAESGGRESGGEEDTIRDGVRRLAHGIRSALVPVPDSAEVVQVAQSLQPDALGPVNRLRQLLAAAGVEQPDWAQHLVMNHVLGSIAAAQEGARQAAVDPAAAAAALGEEAFSWGLEVVLDGLFPAAAGSRRLSGG
ncbi:MAG TPA: TetR family transcriptional regulator [Citricoccus sp.]